MTPGVDVEGLLGRSDRIEEGDTGVAGDQLVVPLEEEQDRHAERARRRLERGPAHRGTQAGQAEHGGFDPGIGGHEAQADARAHGQPPVADAVVAEPGRDEVVNQGGELSDVLGHPLGEGGRLVGVHPQGRPGVAALLDASLDGAAPGLGRLLVRDALAVLRCVERDGGVAPVPHEAPRQPEHLGGALVDRTSVTEDHRRSRPGRRLRQPDDARHDLAALHLQPDPPLDDTALADFLDQFHAPSPPLEVIRSVPIGARRCDETFRWSRRPRAAATPPNRRRRPSPGTSPRGAARSARSDRRATAPGRHRARPTARP